MKQWALHFVSAAIGVLVTLAAFQVFDVLARLDRIERYLTQVSQVLRG